MAESGQSRADANRAIRQAALREQIKADQLIRQILVRVGKLDGLIPESPKQEASDDEWKAYNKKLAAIKPHAEAFKAANDASLRLLAKVLPDLKAVELSQDPENPVFKDERTLDSVLSRLVETVNAAEGRVAAAPTGKGQVH